MTRTFGLDVASKFVLEAALVAELSDGAEVVVDVAVAWASTLGEGPVETWDRASDTRAAMVIALIRARFKPATPTGALPLELRDLSSLSSLAFSSSCRLRSRQRPLPLLLLPRLIHS